MRNLPYNRADRVGKQIYQIVASYLYENVEDQRLIGVQITGVHLTRDFSIARIYFYIEGGKEKQLLCKEALQEIKGELRKYIGEEISIRTLPKLEFLVDEDMESSERIQQIFRDLHKE